MNKSPATTTESHVPSRGVDPARVRVGADIVELITSGMYVAPITVFREYVQNAADAIDDSRAKGLRADPGRVDINIDHSSRCVTIRDNGSGVPADQVEETLLAIGGSPKRGTLARGFRGVGRLSGLAYCRELVFATKAPGEDVETIVRWDAIALRNGIAASGSEGDIREVIASAVEIETRAHPDKAEHFFEVQLRGVIRHRLDVLINEHAISHYLSQVAPLPFSQEFSFGAQIAERLAEAGQPLAPIELIVAGQRVERPYRDRLTQPGTDKKIELREIEFFELLDVDGHVGAVGWLAHHDYVRSISTSMAVRGLRARVGDVQVGESDLFDSSFREPRFNGWTIGEVHILDRRIVPNGRRDNFDVSHHSNNLLVQLGPITAGISQRCRTSSVARTAAAIVRNTIADAEQLISQGSPDTLSVSRALGAVGRSQHKLRRIAEEDTREALAQELERVRAALSSLRPTKSAGIIAADQAVDLVNKIITNRDQAKKLIQALRQL